MHWLEKLAFRLIGNSYDNGKVLFVEDLDELNTKLKNEDELLNIMKIQEDEIKRLSEKIMKLEYEIDSQMVLLNEIRKERMNN